MFLETAMLRGGRSGQQFRARQHLLNKMKGDKQHHDAGQAEDQHLDKTGPVVLAAFQSR